MDRTVLFHGCERQSSMSYMPGLFWGNEGVQHKTPSWNETCNVVLQVHRWYMERKGHTTWNKALCPARSTCKKLQCSRKCHKSELRHGIAALVCKSGRPFATGELVKECLTMAAEILCSTKKDLFSSISLSRNKTHRIEDMSRDISELVRTKIKAFSAYSLLPRHGLSSHQSYLEQSLVPSVPDKREAAKPTTSSLLQSSVFVCVCGHIITYLN